MAGSFLTRSFIVRSLRWVLAVILFLAVSTGLLPLLPRALGQTEPLPLSALPESSQAATPAPPKGAEEIRATESSISATPPSAPAAPEAPVEGALSTAPPPEAARTKPTKPPEPAADKPSLPEKAATDSAPVASSPTSFLKLPSFSTAPPASEGNTGPLETVVLQLKWHHRFQAAGYYAAIAKGYYRQAGLDVKIKTATQKKPVAAVVEQGEADFGVGDSTLILARAQQKPLVVLSTIFQHSPTILLARRHSDTKTVHDLMGKTIMIDPSSAEIYAYLKSEGLDISKLRIVPQDGTLEDFISGKVAVISCDNTDMLFQLKALGIETTSFEPRSGGINFYGDNLFTSEEQIRRHPERVQKFLEASLKGWEYAMANPEEIIQIILHDYAPQKTSEELTLEAFFTRQYIRPDFIKMGTMNPARWRAIAHYYEEFGFIPDAEKALDGFLYDPNTKGDMRIVYWSLGGTAILLLLTFAWGIPLYRINRKLQRQIVERKKTEEDLLKAQAISEEAGEAKNRFLASISHEIRTPLNIVIGYAQTLSLRNRLNVEDANAVHAIAESGQHLLRLVENILDLSKIEAGKVDLVPVDFDLGTLLRSLKAVFQESCARKRVSLVLAWHSDGPCRVHADEGKIRQILFNLIGNAVKFSERGEIILRVIAKGAHLYSFEVIDQGPGLSEEDRKRIFQPFEQTAMGSQKGGTGLGLPISERLLNLMGSSISLVSEPGKGCSFSFSLHLPPAVSPAPLPGEEPSRHRMLAEGCSVTALVIDDVALNRDIIKHMLEGLGCEVLSAASGEEALKVAQERLPDIAFVDMRMDQMNGAETAEELRKIAGERPLRLVCFSASATSGDSKQYLNAGFDDLLPKPFRFERVRECLEQLPGIRFQITPGLQRSSLDGREIPIPPDTAQKLLDAAEIGDFTAVRSLLDRLDERQPTSPLLRKMRIAAESFDARTIMSSLEAAARR